MVKRSSKPSVAKKDAFLELDFVALVDIVRKSRNNDRTNKAFNEIERRMRPRLRQISYKFTIPGSSQADVFQEALFALRYKAIKDYDKTRGNDTGPYPFEKFAVLCVRRHLSTKLKASYQNKSKVLNLSISLDQDRNDGSENNLFLANIVPCTEGGVLETVGDNEYHKRLFSQLFKKLSDFEKQVFVLYVQKRSYEEISDIINAKLKKSKKRHRANVKSVDNALSRIKNKSREIFKKYGDID
jgi:RNA polymerase sporulation-specific sigma factor